MSPMTRNRRRAIYAVLLAVAFGCLIAAVLLTEDPEEITRPEGIIAVSPVENATEVRQVTVYAEISSEYEAALIIDRQEIPKDQVTTLLTGNRTRFSFAPGEGKAFTRFRAGNICASVVYWPVNTDRETTSRSYVWCFKLQ